MGSVGGVVVQIVACRSSGCGFESYPHTHAYAHAHTHTTHTHAHTHAHTQTHTHGIAYTTPREYMG